MVKDLRPWHERVDDADDDSFMVGTDEPSGRFNADEMEFESFMFDPGMGSTAVQTGLQSEPLARLDVSAPPMSSPLQTQVATSSSPLSSVTIDEAPALSALPTAAPGPVEVTLPGNGSGGYSPLQPWPATPSSSLDFSPAQSVSPADLGGAITGHEVPMPSYLRAEAPEEPSAPQMPEPEEVEHAAEPSMEAQVQPQESSHVAADEAESPASMRDAEPPTGTGPLRVDAVQPVGAPSDAITQAVRALSDTGPLRSGRRPSRSTGPLSRRSTGPLGSAGAGSPQSEQPMPVAASIEPTAASPADRWSDSYLAQLEDFSQVLLATRTEKRPRPLDRPQTLVASPTTSTGPMAAVVTPEAAEPQTAQDVIGDVPRDSAGVAPFADAEAQMAEASTFEAVEIEQPTGMLQESMVAEHSEPYFDFGAEAADATAASVAPVSTDETERTEEAAVAEPVEMAQGPVSLADVASPEDAPAVMEGQFSGEVVEFEPFMFDAGEQVDAPPLPNPEEFMPAVAEIEAGLEATEGVTPFEAAPPIADDVAQQDSEAVQLSTQAATEPAESTEPAPLTHLEEATDASASPPVSSLPFWLRETGDLQSALSLGHVHIEDIQGPAQIEQQAASTPQEPHMGTIAAEMPAVSEVAELPEVPETPFVFEPFVEVDDAPQMAQPEMPPTFEAPVIDDYSDLPPITPFDFSMIEQPEEEESFGFNTEELAGLAPGRQDTLAVTTDLDALADLLGTGPTSGVLGDVPTLEAQPAPSAPSTPTTPVAPRREEGTGRLRPGIEDRPRTPSWTSTVTSNLSPELAGGFEDALADVAPDSASLMAAGETGAAALDVPDIDPFDFTEMNLDSDEAATGQLDVRVIPGTGILEQDTDAGRPVPGTALLGSESDDTTRRGPGTTALEPEPERVARGTDRLELEPETVAEREAPIAREPARSSNWQTRTWLDVDEVPSGGPMAEALVASDAPTLEYDEPQEVERVESEMPTGWLGDVELPLFNAQEEAVEPVSAQESVPAPLLVQEEELMLAGDEGLDTGELPHIGDMPAATGVLDTPDLPAAETPGLHIMEAQHEEPTMEASPATQVEQVAYEEPEQDMPPALPAQSQRTTQLPQIDDAPPFIASSQLNDTRDIAQMQVEMPTGWLGDADLTEASPEIVPEVAPTAEPTMAAPAAEADGKPKRGRAKTEKAEKTEKADAGRAQPVSKARVARADWAERRLMEMQDSDEAAFMDISDTLDTSEEGYTMAKDDNAEQQPAGGRDAQSKRGGFSFPSKLLSSGPLPELDSFDELQDMTNRNPDDLSAHMALAAAYTQAGELDPALRVYRRLLKKRNLSTTMMQMIADELAEFERDARGQPRFHQVLGDLYMKQGLYREAIEEYNKIG